MKYTKLYSCLFALAMFFLASVSTMAQELTLNAVTFLKPGEKATIAVGLTNRDGVNGLQTRISLPEGLTFVEKTNNAKRFNINKTERTDDMTLILSKIDEKTATMVGFGAEVKAGKGDVFTFDVNVADNYSGANAIKLSGIQLNVPNQPVVKPANMQSKVVDVENQVTFGATAPALTVGENITVTFNMAFAKTIMRGAAFKVELPQGLTLVDNSAKVGTLESNHKINIVNNLVTINLKDYDEPDAFSAHEGSLCTFDVKADETFVDGSEIKVKNFRCWGAGGSTEYYGADFALKLAKSTTGINGVSANEVDADGIYLLNGVRSDRMQKGVNIVVKDGKRIKVLKK